MRPNSSHLPHRVDTLVIGAGAAGLSLGRRLALSHSVRDVLIVDARTGYCDDRTWSFWSERTHDLRHLVHHEWSRWRYDSGAAWCEHDVPGVTYQSIRGIDFYTEAQAVIARSASVRLRLGVAVCDVRAVAPDTDGYRVAIATKHGVILARHVIDTRPRATAALLYQCFAGSEVDHGGQCTGATPGVAGLMTRMRTDECGFAFTYVLPLTESTALVEFTRFSRQPVSLGRIAHERDHELRVMGLGNATVLRRESGILPMGRLGAPPATVEGVVLAGNGGGALRASTGYGFARMQAWARECAAQLVRGEAPVGHPDDGLLQRQLDRIFLQTLHASPERAPEFFMSLAKTVAPERLLRFLSDRATLRDLFAIVASLPVLPFLAQLPDRRAAIAAIGRGIELEKRDHGASIRLRAPGAAHT